MIMIIIVENQKVRCRMIKWGYSGTLEVPKNQSDKQESGSSPSCGHAMYMSAVGRIDWDLDSTCWGSRWLIWRFLCLRLRCLAAWCWCAGCSRLAAAGWRSALASSRWLRNRRWLRCSWWRAARYCLCSHSTHNGQDEGNQDEMVSHQEFSRRVNSGTQKRRRAAGFIAIKQIWQVRDGQEQLHFLSN